MEAHPLLLLAGPTASGKTSLALALAEALHAEGVRLEIVSCDSVAVYRGMDIGSAKPSAADRARAPHGGLDWLSVAEPCTAGDYARRAREAIAGITARGAVPLVVGGTGLYFRALIEGLDAAPQRDAALRERLERSARRHGGGAWLHRLLRRVRPAAAKTIHPNDVPKLVRALELVFTRHAPRPDAQGTALTGYRVLELALGPGRTALYRRIDARVEQMFAAGLIAETRALREQFGDDAFPLRALGYAQAMGVLRAEISTAQAMVEAQAGHRQYAKRQLTWFRNQRRMHWLAGFGDDPAVFAESLSLVRAFLETTGEQQIPLCGNDSQR